MIQTPSLDLSLLTQHGTPAAKAEAVELLQKRQELLSQRVFYALFPDEDTIWQGPTIKDGLLKHGQTIYSRHKYAPHMEWLAAGGKYRERAAIFGNRTGKTTMAAFEVACHLTGIYRPWWVGKRFDQPISAWVAGDTFETTRATLQQLLLGGITTKDSRKVVDGCGVIPGHLIGRCTWHSGVQDLIDTVEIQHEPTGGTSYLQFKSSDQGRRSFQGTSRQLIWLDEECPKDVYEECLMRTATVDGITMLTFTPLSGLTPLVLSFLPSDQRPDMAA